MGRCDVDSPDRRSAVLALGLLPIAITSLPLTAAPLWLVTPQEVARDQAAPEPADLARPRAAPKTAIGPTIELLLPEPDVQHRLSSPFPIVVRFIAPPDSEVDPSSFRVLYGRLRLDITSRIVAAVPVTREGFDLQEAAIPSGRHQMVMQIADRKKRVGELDVRVRVV